MEVKQIPETFTTTVVATKKLGSKLASVVKTTPTPSVKTTVEAPKTTTVTTTTATVTEEKPKVITTTTPKVGMTRGSKVTATEKPKVETVKAEPTVRTTTGEKPAITTVKTTTPPSVRTTELPSIKTTTPPFPTPMASFNGKPLESEMGIPVAQRQIQTLRLSPESDIKRVVTQLGKTEQVVGKNIPDYKYKYQYDITGISQENLVKFLQGQKLLEEPKTWYWKYLGLGELKPSRDIMIVRTEEGKEYLISTKELPISQLTAMEVERIRTEYGVQEKYKTLKEWERGTGLKRIGAEAFKRITPFISSQDPFGIKSQVLYLKGDYERLAETQEEAQKEVLRKYENLGRSPTVGELAKFTWETPSGKVFVSYVGGYAIGTAGGLASPFIPSGVAKAVSSPIFSGTLLGISQVPTISQAIYYEQPIEEVAPKVGMDIASFESMRAGVRGGFKTTEMAGQRLERYVESIRSKPTVQIIGSSEGKAIAERIGYRVPIGKEGYYVTGVTYTPSGKELGQFLEYGKEIGTRPTLYSAITGKGWVEKPYTVTLTPKVIYERTFGGGEGEKFLITKVRTEKIGDYELRAVKGELYGDFSKSPLFRYEIPQQVVIHSDIPITSKVEPIRFGKDILEGKGIKQMVWKGKTIYYEVTTPKGEKFIVTDKYLRDLDKAIKNVEYFYPYEAETGKEIAFKGRVVKDITGRKEIILSDKEFRRLMKLYPEMGKTIGKEGLVMDIGQPSYVAKIPEELELGDMSKLIRIREVGIEQYIPKVEGEPITYIPSKGLGKIKPFTKVEPAVSTSFAREFAKGTRTTATIGGGFPISGARTRIVAMTFGQPIFEITTKEMEQPKIETPKVIETTLPKGMETVLPETKLETKPEIKLETKPEMKLETKPEVMPEIKSEVIPEVGVMPETVVTPIAEPVVEPIAIPKVTITPSVEQITVPSIKIPSGFAFVPPSLPSFKVPKVERPSVPEIEVERGKRKKTKTKALYIDPFTAMVMQASGEYEVGMPEYEAKEIERVLYKVPSFRTQLGLGSPKKMWKRLF